MTISPNDDPWARAMLEHFGEDPDDERIDPNVPDEWRELGAVVITRIKKEGAIDADLAQYDDNDRFRAEYRSVVVADKRLHYRLTFLRES